MSISPAEDRDLAPAAAPKPRLVLSPLDKAAAVAFAGDGDLGDLIEDARALAEVLAGPDGDAGRVRLLARAAAAARTQQRVLEVLLGERLARRDGEGVELINRTLDGVSRRFVALARQLSAESALKRRPSIYVGHADEVTVGDRRGP